MKPVHVLTGNNIALGVYTSQQDAIDSLLMTPFSDGAPTIHYRDENSVEFSHRHHQFSIQKVEPSTGPGPVF